MSSSIEKKTIEKKTIESIKNIETIFSKLEDPIKNNYKNNLYIQILGYLKKIDKIIEYNIFSIRYNQEKIKNTLSNYLLYLIEILIVNLSSYLFINSHNIDEKKKNQIDKNILNNLINKSTEIKDIKLYFKNPKMMRYKDDNKIDQFKNQFQDKINDILDKIGKYNKIGNYNYYDISKIFKINPQQYNMLNDLLITGKETEQKNKEKRIEIAKNSLNKTKIQEILEYISKFLIFFYEDNIEKKFYENLITTINYEIDRKDEHENEDIKTERYRYFLCKEIILNSIPNIPSFTKKTAERAAAVAADRGAVQETAREGAERAAAAESGAAKGRAEVVEADMAMKKNEKLIDITDNITDTNRIIMNLKKYSIQLGIQLDIFNLLVFNKKIDISIITNIYNNISKDNIFINNIQNLVEENSLEKNIIFTDTIENFFYNKEEFFYNEERFEYLFKLFKFDINHKLLYNNIIYYYFIIINIQIKKIIEKNDFFKNFKEPIQISDDEIEISDDEIKNNFYKEYIKNDKNGINDILDLFVYNFYTKIDEIEELFEKDLIDKNLIIKLIMSYFELIKEKLTSYGKILRDYINSDIENLKQKEIFSNSNPLTGTDVSTDHDKTKNILKNFKGELNDEELKYISLIEKYESLNSNCESLSSVHKFRSFSTIERYLEHIDETYKLLHEITDIYYEIDKTIYTSYKNIKLFYKKNITNIKIYQSLIKQLIHDPNNIIDENEIKPIEEIKPIIYKIIENKKNEVFQNIDINIMIYIIKTKIKEVIKTKIKEGTNINISTIKKNIFKNIFTIFKNINLQLNDNFNEIIHYVNENEIDYNENKNKNEIIEYFYKKKIFSLIINNLYYLTENNTKDILLDLIYFNLFNSYINSLITDKKDMKNMKVSLEDFKNKISENRDDNIINELIEKIFNKDMIDELIKKIFNFNDTSNSSINFFKQQIKEFYYEKIIDDYKKNFPTNIQEGGAPTTSTPLGRPASDDNLLSVRAAKAAKAAPSPATSSPAAPKSAWGPETTPSPAPSAAPSSASAPAQPRRAIAPAARSAAPSAASARSASPSTRSASPSTRFAPSARSAPSAPNSSSTQKKPENIEIENIEIENIFKIQKDIQECKKVLFEFTNLKETINKVLNNLNNNKLQFIIQEDDPDKDTNYKKIKDIITNNSYYK